MWYSTGSLTKEGALNTPCGPSVSRMDAHVTEEDEPRLPPRFLDEGTERSTVALNFDLVLSMNFGLRVITSPKLKVIEPVMLMMLCKKMVRIAHGQTQDH